MGREHWHLGHDQVRPTATPAVPHRRTVARGQVHFRAAPLPLGGHGRVGLRAHAGGQQVLDGGARRPLQFQVQGFRRGGQPARRTGRDGVLHSGVRRQGLPGVCQDDGGHPECAAAEHQNRLRLRLVIGIIIIIWGKIY